MELERGVLPRRFVDGRAPPCPRGAVRAGQRGDERAVAHAPFDRIEYLPAAQHSRQSGPLGERAGDVLDPPRRLVRAPEIVRPAGRQRLGVDGAVADARAFVLFENIEQRIRADSELERLDFAVAVDGDDDRPCLADGFRDCLLRGFQGFGEAFLARRAGAAGEAYLALDLLPPQLGAHMVARGCEPLARRRGENQRVAVDARLVGRGGFLDEAPRRRARLARIRNRLRPQYREVELPVVGDVARALGQHVDARARGGGVLRKAFLAADRLGESLLHGFRRHAVAAGVVVHLRQVRAVAEAPGFRRTIAGREFGFVEEP